MIPKNTKNRQSLLKGVFVILCESQHVYMHVRLPTSHKLKRHRYRIKHLNDTLHKALKASADSAIVKHYIKCSKSIAGPNVCPQPN